jgi:hypothetical protein
VLGAAAGLAPAVALAQPAGPKAVEAEIPIEVDSVPWTGVWIEGKGPFRFNITSGTNSFTIWEDLAERLNLRQLQVTNLQRRGNDRRPVNVFRADEMVIGGKLGLTAVDFVSFKSERPPTPVGNIPLFGDRVTSFEFARGLMRYSVDLPDLAGYQRVPLIYEEQFLAWEPEAKVKLGGRDLRLRIATGNSGGIFIYSTAVSRLKLWDGPGAAFDRTAAGPEGGGRTRTTRRGDLEFGDVRFANPVVRLEDPKTSRYREDDFDGSIGMELLRRGDLVFDQKRRVLWFKPLANMADPWRYDRAGFDLAEKEGVWRFDAVDAGSPAERAGLKVGDVLAAQRPDTGPRLRAAVQGSPGTKLAFTVNRGGATQRIEITLEDRL